MKRIFPHFVVRAPIITAISGHQAITIFFWTFTRSWTISPHLRAHEYRHVVQWVDFTLMGAAMHTLYSLLTGHLWWAVLVFPWLYFPAFYFLSFIPNGYHGSWLEKDAERYANKVAP